jgi:hypothetical protein
LKYFTGACLLALTIGSANATTFDWTLSGNPSFGITGSGTLTASESGGQYLVDSIFGSVSDSCGGGPPCAPQYRNIIGLLTPNQAYGGLTHIGGDNLIFPAPASTSLDSQGLVFSIGGIGGDPCPFTSGCYMNISYSPNSYGGAPWFTPQYALYVSNAGSNPVDFVLTAEVATTPLPAALPLFASSLGALGLLGWRKKRKAAAIAA